MSFAGTIRAVDVELDVAAIRRIYEEQVLTGTASWEYEAPDVAEMAWRIRAVLEDGFPYFAAVLDGEVLGYAYASSFRQRAGYRFTVENSVYVCPAAQRRGVARGLMRALIAEWAARGFRQILAVIGDSGNVASIELQRSLGFVHAATLRGIGFKFERWLDGVIMQLELDDWRQLEFPVNDN